MMEKKKEVMMKEIKPGRKINGEKSKVEKTERARGGTESNQKEKSKKGQEAKNRKSKKIKVENEII